MGRGGRYISPVTCILWYILLLDIKSFYSTQLNSSQTHQLNSNTPSQLKQNNSTPTHPLNSKCQPQPRKSLPSSVLSSETLSTPQTHPPSAVLFPAQVTISLASPQPPPPHQPHTSCPASRQEHAVKPQSPIGRNSLNVLEEMLYCKLITIFYLAFMWMKSNSCK